MNAVDEQYTETSISCTSGPLDAVLELNVNITNSSVLLITWNPPYTLVGVSILYYYVNIKVNNNSLNVSVEDATVYYPIEIEPAQTELNISVTVVPVNKVGKGMATSKHTTTSLLDKGKLCLNNHTLHIELLFINTVL